MAAPLPWIIARELQSYTFTPVDARAVSYTARVVDNKELRNVLEYRYGSDFDRTGMRMFPTPGPLPQGETSDSMRSAYPEGARFTAYVNPLDPSDAIVYPGLRGSTLRAAMVITPFMLLAWGLCLAAWRAARGPRGDRLHSDVLAVRDPGGNWRLRVMLVTPPGLALAVLGVASLATGGFFLGENPHLSDAVAGWIAVLALSGAAFAWLYLRMRRGRYDWRYDAVDGLLHPPGGAAPWPRSGIAGLELAKSTSKDSDGDVTYNVAVRLRSSAGELRDVTSAGTFQGFDASMADVAAVVRFLEEKLGLPAEVVSAT